MSILRWPLLSLLLPLFMAGVDQGPAPTAGFSAVAPSPAVFVSVPRQSIPAPVHDEATCAFCQAAAFAPHAAAPAGGLPEAWSSERRELPSRNDRLTHSGSLRPPRSRAPPTFRVM